MTQNQRLFLLCCSQLILRLLSVHSAIIPSLLGPIINRTILERIRRQENEDYAEYRDLVAKIKGPNGKLYTGIGIVDDSVYTDTDLSDQSELEVCFFDNKGCVTVSGKQILKASFFTLLLLGTTFASNNTFVEGDVDPMSQPCSVVGINHKPVEVKFEHGESMEYFVPEGSAAEVNDVVLLDGRIAGMIFKHASGRPAFLSAFVLAFEAFIIPHMDQILGDLEHAINWEARALSRRTSGSNSKNQTVSAAFMLKGTVPLSLMLISYITSQM